MILSSRSLAVHMAPDLFSAPFAQLLSEVAMPTRSIRSCAVFEKNEIEFHRGRLELVRLPGRVPKLSTRIFGPITVSSSQNVSLTPCSKTRFLSNFFCRGLLALPYNSQSASGALVLVLSGSSNFTIVRALLCYHIFDSVIFSSSSI